MSLSENQLEDFSLKTTSTAEAIDCIAILSSNSFNITLPLILFFRDYLFFFKGIAGWSQMAAFCPCEVHNVTGSYLVCLLILYSMMLAKCLADFD